MSEYFFIAGAQRSGTTYLYQLLAEHPEIEMAVPPQPEPKFFLLDDLFERGLEYYKTHFFHGKAGAWLRGEKSTSYMESEKAAERIARCFPGAKILFILRDPIERAISNYWYSVNNGLEALPMAEAFLHEEERRQDYDRKRTSVSPFAYLQRGRYADYISMYDRHFPRKSVTVILYEQFVTSPDVLRDLYGFLGVAADFSPPSLGEIINKGNKTDSKLSPQLARYLVEYFMEPNARLSKRLGVDLREWRRE